MTAALRVLLGVALLATWQAVWQLNVMPRGTISSPLAVATTSVGWLLDGTLARNLPTTLFEVAVGFAIGALSGIALAVLFANVPTLARIADPLMSTLNTVPLVILAPLFTLALGHGVMPKILLSALLVFFAIFFNVSQGLGTIDRVFIDSVRLQGASRRAVITNVMLPASELWVLGTLRLGVSFAFLAAVVGEYLGSTVGIGYVIALGANMGFVDHILAGLLVVAVLVLVVEVGLGRLERRFANWRLF